MLLELRETNVTTIMTDDQRSLNACFQLSVTETIIIQQTLYITYWQSYYMRTKEQIYTDYERRQSERHSLLCCRLSINSVNVDKRKLDRLADYTMMQCTRTITVGCGNHMTIVWVGR